MIAALKGAVIFQGANYIIVAVNDVGYKVFVASPAQWKIESEASFFTHHHITEAVSDLYGFAALAELEFFEQVLGVSGVGPKTALAICSQPIEKIKTSIVNSDPSYLTAIGGIGAKLASKIIVELRPKFVKGQADLAVLGRDDEELIRALAQLGYRRQEVSQVARQIPDGPIDERVKHALKVLGS